jgi:uncharacterized membrane protein
MPNRTAYSVVQLILSLIGTFDAGTLYYAHRNNIDLPCSSGGGCDVIAQSHWAYFHGEPVALLGTCAYIALALMSVLKQYSERDSFASALSWLMLAVSAGGTVFSWRLQYIAAVDIGAFCIYCRASAIVMTLIFLTTLVERVQIWRNPTVEHADVMVGRDAPAEGK